MLKAILDSMYVRLGHFQSSYNLPCSWFTALVPITFLQCYFIVLSLIVPHQFWSNLQAQHHNIFVTVSRETKDSRAWFLGKCMEVIRWLTIQVGLMPPRDPWMYPSNGETCREILDRRNPVPHEKRNLFPFFPNSIRALNRHPF